MRMSTPPWALILAGGDGTRLRPLTSPIVGDPRPKQFCPIVDGETLLDRTRRRADRLVRYDRQVIVVTRAHEPYYRALAYDLAPERLVVQPDNRGTAAGILYPLLRMISLAGNVPVVIMPSDHYVSDDMAFMSYAASAVETVVARPEIAVLLGIEATSPETEYGWIEPWHMPLPLEGEAVFPIRRFWEKPSPTLADRLLRLGCLWNSFVMVGFAGTFLGMIWSAVPELILAFDRLRQAIGTPAEAETADAVYATAPTVNFSERVLARPSPRLATIRVKGVDWSDWGHPQRVLATVRQVGWKPSWLSRVELASTG
jgi:mannose-1-phosphate guanylyltransferase